MLKKYSCRLSKSLKAAALGAGALALTTASPAQADFPEKPVTVMVAWAAGGATDSVTRALQDTFARELGTDIVVKNVSGAAGTIGTAEVAGARPDGYSVLITPAGPMTTQPHLRKIPYNMQSFEPIGRITVSPMLMMTAPESRLKSVQDVIDAAKATPGELRFASTGAGTLPHISILALDDLAGIKSKHVPFKGSANAVKALLGGVVEIFSDQAQLSPKYELPPLAAWSAERLDEYPNVPTMKELGYDIVMGNWVGMFAPKGTPQDVKDKLTAALKATVEDATVIKNLANLKLKPAWQDQDAFGKFASTVYKQNGELLANAGLIAK